MSASRPCRAAAAAYLPSRSPQPEGGAREPRATARRLDGLQLLMSRQSVEEQPQTHVLTLAGGAGAPAAERQLSRFPHPYPTLRGLQARAPLRPPLGELHGGGAIRGCRHQGLRVLAHALSRMRRH